MKKILFLLIAMIMVGCTVVDTTGPDYYEEIQCDYHFENDCGEEFVVKEETMTAEKQYYYEHYYDSYGCGLYRLTYRNNCYAYDTYY